MPPSTNGNSASASPTAGQHIDKSSSVPIWDLAAPALDEWVTTVRSMFPPFSDTAKQTPAEVARSQLVPILWKNMQNSLAATNTHPVLREEETRKADDADADESTPPAKRVKKNPGKKNVDSILGHGLSDPFKIWMHSKEVASNITKTTATNSGDAAPTLLMDAIPSTTGAKLAELSIMGMINGLGGQLGGLVDKLGNPLTPDIKSKPIPLAMNTADGAPPATATLDQIRQIAFALHQSVQTRLEKDVLDTTPLRIHLMLAPDLTPQEFKAVRRRIYDTVVLGKGLKGEDIADDIPVATNAQGVHDIEKFKKCKVCGENDQSNFILDRKNGDVICSSCGTVASESLMHEGSQFRKFEGEVDRNHHGDPGNPLYSNAHNMGTSLGGVQMTSGAGMGGFGSQGKGRGLETILRNAHAYTELNVSSFGNKDNVGRTRVGYKDKQKKSAFIQMNHVGDALNLHEAVIQRAKEIFSGFRDDRELLHQLKAVIAACICEAFDQLARDGRKILQQQEQGIEEPDDKDGSNDDEDEKMSAEAIAANKKMLNNRRAMRRAELHKASMAGKGGLLLDFSEVKNAPVESKSSGAAASNAAAAAVVASSLDNKPASTWDIEDCRSWLLEASRSIAQTWVDERDGADSKKKAPGTKRNIPKGSRDELEGKLVEDSIALCEFLETQLRKSAVKAGGAGRRVVTPRVTDMSHLGIKWQHAHERGSGGKGGVGNSGKGGAAALMAKKAAAAGAGSSRKAGQILIIQSAAKLGAILKDPLAGESFHRELRTVIGRQEARKGKELRDEAARQRLLQMKRKPWLQAKVSGST